MSSTVKVIAIVLVTTWAGGCASMEEKERASSNDESKAEFEAVFKDLSLQLKEELFERYFGMRRSDFENRKIYTELNPEIIRTIPDDKLEQAIRDFTYAAIKDDLDNIETKIPALGPGFSAVYFVSTAEREVSNGGFNQLFFNEGRRAVELAEAGAELMDLSEIASVIAQALAIEEVEREKLAKAKEAGTIEAFFDSYDESFDEADQAFFNLKIDFEKEFISFIRRRADLFVGKVE